MQIKNIGHQTDLIFNSFSGIIKSKKDYTVIQTPSNTGYYWGNYLIFSKPPQIDDCQRWMNIFDQEFPYYNSKHHYAFTWNNVGSSSLYAEEFLKNSFKQVVTEVMTLEDFKKNKNLNSSIKIKIIETEKEWNDVLNLQITCSEQSNNTKSFKNFKKKQFIEYIKMSKLGMGNWYGAYIENNLVGDLGIFHKNNVGRYQNVETHPNYRNLGICKTLVNLCGEMALEKYNLKSLVIASDLNDYAKHIYESIGFKTIELNHSLIRFDCQI